VLDDDWGGLVTTIELDPDRLQPSATDGLAEFSHVEVVYVFHHVAPDDVHTGARHPRNNPDWPSVGVLAQRVKNRPNRIGITTCELVSVAALTVVVRGLDAVDATPILDIKPYMVEFGPRGPVRQPDWSHELMSRYW
jgi:tRNA (Thr-GGU) A37 N-methylase